MFKLFKKKNNGMVLKAMIDGTVIPITEVSDEVFSNKMMGDGIAIRPTGNTVYAPCDGIVSVIMKETNHAVGMTLENGLNLLIHVGLDTVLLKGEGMQCLVEEQQQVKAGEPLLSFNRELLESKGICLDTMLVILEEGQTLEPKFFTGIEAKANETIIIEM